MSGMADLNPLPKSAGNRWSSTAAQRDPAHTRPQDLAGLRAHAEDCESVRGRFFYLRCKADAVRSFAASRVITTLSTVVVLALILWLVN